LSAEAAIVGDAMTGKWSPDESFEDLKRELMKVDPVHFAETYLTLDNKPMRLTGNGWKFIADIYRTS